jgi:lactate dehydrogenase-like 2-hydroxyacid dehydrogenase
MSRIYARTDRVRARRSCESRRCEIIAAIGERGYLINVSRGAVIDEDALITALKSGTLGGAGLDVFVEEPTPAARWADVPNVVLTPHLGGATRQALYESDMNVLENLRRHFAAEPLLTPVLSDAR